MLNHLPSYSLVEFHLKKNDTLLIIPVWNEKDKLIEQLHKIQKIHQIFDILIVDGNSTDGILEEFHQLDNLGVTAVIVKNGIAALSAQLRIGFEYAIRSGYEFIITMDGNNKDDPDGIIAIRSSLQSGNDFVQGSRFIQGGLDINTPITRKLAIKLIHAPLTSMFSRRKFTDTTNGFRGFTSKVLSDKNIAIQREIFQSYELIFYLPIQISRLGYVTKEIPVTRAYPINENTPTKIKGIRIKIKLIKILISAGMGKYNP